MRDSSSSIHFRPSASISALRIFGTTLNQGREGEAKPETRPPQAVLVASVAVGSTIAELIGRPRLMLLGVGRPPADCVSQIDLRGKMNSAQSLQFCDHQDCRQFRRETILASR